MNTKPVALLLVISGFAFAGVFAQWGELPGRPVANEELNTVWALGCGQFVGTLPGAKACGWTSAVGHGGNLCRQTWTINQGSTCDAVNAACGGCTGFKDKDCTGTLDLTDPDLCYEWNTTCCTISNTCQNAINQQQQSVCNCTLNVGGPTAMGTKQLARIKYGPGPDCPDFGGG